jgi:lipoate-protein ligase A
VILWIDGAHSPAENMRRDASLLAAAEAGAPPVLRLFSFVPHGITLGMGQDPARQLDLERCARDGVAWAARPTGGRAIFHADEWTYSLASPIAHPDWGGSLDAVYARVSALLIASLRRLGVPAEWAAGATRSPALAGSAAATAAPCFASTARHEVEIGGRKLIGSAQRRTRSAVLQQGSVLLGPGHLRLADYLAIADPDRARVRQRLEEASSHAGPWLPDSPPLARWGEALQAEIEGLTRRFDGASGAFLLTLPKTGSYTRAFA